MKQVELNIQERINLLAVLPLEGENFVVLHHVQKLREQLVFTEKETEEGNIKFSEDGTKVEWNGVITKTFDIPDMVYDVIGKRLEKLETESKATMALLPLYVKFVKTIE